MLINRLLSIAALVSVAAPILATPLPRSDGHETRLNALGGEVEVESSKGGLEFEVEHEKLGLELETEVNIKRGGVGSCFLVLYTELVLIHCRIVILDHKTQKVVGRVCTRVGHGLLDGLSSIGDLLSF